MRAVNTPNRPSRHRLALAALLVLLVSGQVRQVGAAMPVQPGNSAIAQAVASGDRAELIRAYESTPAGDRASLPASAVVLVVIAYDRAGRESDALAALAVLLLTARQSDASIRATLRVIHPRSVTVERRINALLAQSTVPRS
jgi:hypothetical protein